MTDIRSIFQQYSRQYLSCFPTKILPSHKRTVNDIIHCRTEAMGGHIEVCSHCDQVAYVYHSCRNRHCPQCQRSDSEKWVAKRNDELLPVMYFHVVFTVPRELRRLIRSNQKILLDIQMKAAAYSLIKLGADKKYVGGKIGLLAVLHTWTGALIYHPHVHCLVPGGGYIKQIWVSSHGTFLVPVKALSPIYKAKFRDMALKALPELKVEESVWQKDWVVYCKPTLQGSQKILQYLGRYVYRTAITNNRLLSLKSGKVTFRYKETRREKNKWQRQWRTMELPVFEFIRRFLQHVLPRGFHKVRYYGILNPTNRNILKRLQLLLAAPVNDEDIEDVACEIENILSNSEKICGSCNQGTMKNLGYWPREFYHNQRDPPKIRV